MKEVVNFLKEAIELTGQIAELTGRTASPKTKGQPKGYVIRTGTGSSPAPVKRLLSNTKRAEFTFSLNVEPILGEPFSVSISARLRRGGSNVNGGKSNKAGGADESSR